MHPGQTTSDETHVASGRRSIPAKQPVMKPARRSAGDPSRLTASLRAAHRCVSVGIHSVFLPHAPCQPGASPASALTRVPPQAVHRVASRRSSLRFGRNTLGIPPLRALSAGRLTDLGAHAGSTTGCSPRLYEALIVALRSKYTRYSSLARLVSRAPRPHREDWPASALTPLCPPAASLDSRAPRLRRNARARANWLAADA